MSDKIQYYVDTQPLGPGYRVVKSAQFFARSVSLPADLAEAIIKQYEEFLLVQSWLKYLYPKISQTTFEVVIPDEIKEVLCPADDQPKEAEPKQKDSAQPSSKKSSPQQSVVGLSSRTNPKKV